VGLREDPGAAAALLRSGAAGMIRPDAPADRLSEALEAVRRGEIWLSRAVFSALVKEAFQSNGSRPLTRRETEIRDLISSGLSNQAIADRLHVSRATVRWHLRSIYTKLGAAERDESGRHPRGRRILGSAR